jgi:hypothetical protein
MDIEWEAKGTVFKELTIVNSPSHYLKTKDVEMTPSSMGQAKK